MSLSKSVLAGIGALALMADPAEAGLTKCQVVALARAAVSVAFL